MYGFRQYSKKTTYEIEMRQVNIKWKITKVLTTLEVSPDIMDVVLVTTLQLNQNTFLNYTRLVPWQMV